MAGQNEDAKSENAKAEHAKAEDARAEDTHAGDAVTDSPGSAGMKPAVVRLGDAKPEEIRAGDVRPNAQSEWTASDSRGPLNAAGEDDTEAPTQSETPSYRPIAPPGTTSAAAERPLASSSQSGPSTVEAPSPAAGRSLWPVAAGIVIGALIGAGSAVLYSYTQSDASAKAQVEALSTRFEALEKRPDPQASVDALKASVADLGAKVAAIPKAPPASQAFDPSPIQDKLGTLEASVAALQKQSAGDNGLAAAVETVKQQGSDLKQQGSDLKGLDDKIAGLAAAVAGLQKQDATAKATVDALQSSQKSLEGKAAAPSLAVAADSLVQQIDRGEPYAAQVDALAGLGADPAKIAVLRESAATGVPNAKALAEKFAPLADPITALAYRPPPNAGMMDRLKSGLFSMVSVRRVDDTSGNDLGSRVSRIEADLAHDDVADAYATWNALPAEAKAKSEAWGALAKTHAEAIAAARALQQQAIAALAAKKS